MTSINLCDSCELLCDLLHLNTNSIDVQKSSGICQAVQQFEVGPSPYVYCLQSYFVMHEESELHSYFNVSGIAKFRRLWPAVENNGADFSFFDVV